MILQKDNPRAKMCVHVHAIPYMLPYPDRNTTNQTMHKRVHRQAESFQSNDYTKRRVLQEKTNGSDGKERVSADEEDDTMCRHPKSEASMNTWVRKGKE